MDNQQIKLRIDLEPEVVNSPRIKYYKAALDKASPDEFVYSGKDALVGFRAEVGKRDPVMLVKKEGKTIEIPYTLFRDLEKLKCFYNWVKFDEPEVYGFDENYKMSPHCYWSLYYASYIRDVGSRITQKDIKSYVLIEAKKIIEENFLKSHKTHIQWGMFSDDDMKVLSSFKKTSEMELPGYMLGM